MPLSLREEKLIHKQFNMTPLDKAAIIAEYDLIVEALKKTSFHKGDAAKLLGIDRKTLSNKLRLYKQAMNQSKQLIEEN